MHFELSNLCIYTYQYIQSHLQDIDTCSKLSLYLFYGSCFMLNVIQYVFNLYIISVALYGFMLLSILKTVLFEHVELIELASKHLIVALSNIYTQQILSKKKFKSGV